LREMCCASCKQRDEFDDACSALADELPFPTREELSEADKAAQALIEEE
jgi:hypothetical protein